MADGSSRPPPPDGPAGLVSAHVDRAPLRRRAVLGLSILAICVVGAAAPLVGALGAKSHAPTEGWTAAEKAFDEGRFREAADALEQYVTDHPGDHDARIKLGWSYYRLGEFGPARSAFTTALAIAPGSTDARVGLGFTTLQLEGPEEAANIFRDALKIGPGLPDALEGLVLAAARPGAERPLLEDGRRAALALLARDPTDSQMTLLLLQLEAALGESVERRLRPDADPADPLTVDFRAGVDYLEARGEGRRWSPLFVKGVNLGAALPGRFPTEFPLDEGTYQDWLDGIAGLGVNTVRLYTLFPPAFYTALAAHNADPAKTPLWSIEGVWSELPARDDFDDPEFVTEFQGEIARVIDAVHGALAVPPRPGHASGIYTSDVSKSVLAFIIGREWEPFAVAAYETLRPRQTSWTGRWFEVRGARAMECWVARMCDYAAGYEARRYRVLRPLTFADWPTLDPLTHPVEASRAEEDKWRDHYGVPRPAALAGAAWEDDGTTLDPTLIHPTAAMKAGFFAAYHIYPNYPDFLNNEPGLARARDAAGPSRYAGYLKALKAYHGRQPVLVAEFGISTSRGIAHLQPQGWHHGGHDEREQGEIVARMLRSIRDERFAGGVIFSFVDEWFKGTWSVAPLEIPADRRRLWFNAESPEQSYGLLAARPASLAIRVDGATADWAGRSALVAAPAPENASSGWTALHELRAAADEGYLYLLLLTGGGPQPPDWSRVMLRIALDTYAPERGERTLPPPAETTATGVEFLVELAGPGASFITVSEPYDPFGHGAGGPFASPVSPSGRFAHLMFETNRERFARDGTRYPAQRINRGALRFGSLDPATPDFDTRTDVAVGAPAGAIELRIPWTLLNVTDPSSGRVLHQEREHEPPFDTVATDGFRIYAFAALRDRPGQGSESLLPAPGTASPVFAWPHWNEPKFRIDWKLGVDRVREAERAIPTWVAPANPGPRPSPEGAHER